MSIRNLGTVVAASLVALALLPAGCASSNAYQKLEAQNKALEKRVNQMQKRLYAAQKQPSPTGPALGMPRPPMPPPQAMVNPMIARRQSGTPQNWAYLNRPSEMCAGTALHFKFENWSGQYLALMLDGEPVKVIGESTVLPHVPPSTSVHFCLLRLGQHTLSGVGFIGRPPRLVRSGKFTKHLDITPSRLGHFAQVYTEEIR